jgi:hypothetical protein
MPLIQDLPRIDSPAAAWRWLRLLGAALQSAFAWAFLPWPRPRPAPLVQPAETVILVTLDGVRPRDVLRGEDGGVGATTPGAPLMPFFREHMMPRGTFLGSDTDPPAFRIGNPIGISLTGYHAILYGRMTACTTNDAPPPKGENLIRDAARAFPGQVAVFSSWAEIVDCLRIDDPAVEVLRGPPNQRNDAETFRSAMARLRADPPRLMYMALDETDDAAHHRGYPTYGEILRRYDAYLAELVSEIDAQMAMGRRVTLIVTTDHGRGEGAEWVEHRWNIQGTARAWLFAMGHGIAAQGHLIGAAQRTHFDIRPTVEHLLGLTPGCRWWAGSVMTEILKCESKTQR